MVGAVWLSALFGLACGQQEANLPASGNQEPKGEASVLSAYEESQVHMATLVRLRFYAAGDAAARTASEAVFGRIKVLNEILSDYSETSELSRLCQTAGTGPTKAGPELYRVLDRSLYWFRESEGRFDVTLAPLIRQWRRARKTKKLPTAEQIAALRPLCGSENMTLDPGTRTVTLAKKGMLLDLGGIAKGYVGDECGRTFHKHGVTRYLIAIGGDLVIGEPPPEKPEGWEVTIADPDQNPEGAIKFLAARCGVSTSGDAAQSSMIGGMRYSHILDPATGIGMTARRQTTVVAPLGIDADALDTSATILGEEKGIALAERHPEVAMRMLTLDEKGAWKESVSSGWKKLKVVAKGK